MVLLVTEMRRRANLHPNQNQHHQSLTPAKIVTRSEHKSTYCGMISDCGDGLRLILVLSVLFFFFFKQDFTPEKKSGGRGGKKAVGRGKKKVNFYPCGFVYLYVKLTTFLSSYPTFPPVMQQKASSDSDSDSGSGSERKVMDSDSEDEKPRPALSGSESQSGSKSGSESDAPPRKGPQARKKGQTYGGFMFCFLFFNPSFIQFKKRTI